MRRLGQVLLAAVAMGLLLEAVDRAAHAFRTPRTMAFELYAIGGSTTTGEPFEQTLSFPSLTAAAFGGHLGGRPIRVENLARPGDSIYPQALGLAARLRYRNRTNPAAVLIYSGHNERFTSDRPESAWAASYRSLRDALVERSALAADALPAVERRLNARGRRTLGHYERYLRLAIRASLDAGAVPILSTLPSNISEIEPTVECTRGTECLEQLADFRRAQQLAKEGDFAAARALFWKVVDADPQNGFGRTTTEQNAVLRRLAAEYRIPLVDAVALFEAKSPHGLLGPGLFSDGHHPSLEGELLLADAFAEELARHYHEPTPSRLNKESALRSAKARPGDLAVAYVYSGRWLLTVSVDHPDPRGRLALAQSRFEAAAAIEPENFRALLGLLLSRTGEDGRFLHEKEGRRLLARLAVAPQERGGRPDARELAEMAAFFRGRGAPEKAVAALLRAGAAR